MKKVLTLLFVLTIISTNLFAKSDGMNFGLRAGINIPSYNLTAKVSGNELKYDVTNSTSFNVGVLAEFPLTGEIAFQPGLLYYVKGGVNAYTYLGQKDEYELSINYLHIPLNFLYKINLGLFTPYVMAGPYISYAMSGKIKETYDGKVTTSDMKFGEGEDLLPFDYGVSFGAGVEYTNFRLILNYDLGLSNIFTAPKGTTGFEGTMKNNVLSISAAFFLR